MGNFESPLGVKKISGSKFREIDVPDETENQGHSHFQQDDDIQESLDFEAQVKAERERKRTGKERLSLGAKNRIEKLIGLTKSTREASIVLNGIDTIFMFESLSGKESRDAIFEASKFDQTSQLSYEIRKQVLARSIVNIAGISIEQFLSSNELEAKLEFIEKLDEALLGRLYDEYLSLLSESRAKFTVNSKNVGEIVEDIKK